MNNYKKTLAALTIVFISIFCTNCSSDLCEMELVQSLNITDRNSSVDIDLDGNSDIQFNYTVTSDSSIMRRVFSVIALNDQYLIASYSGNNTSLANTILGFSDLDLNNCDSLEYLGNETIHTYSESISPESSTRISKGLISDDHFYMVVNSLNYCYYIRIRNKLDEFQLSTIHRMCIM